MTYNNPCWCHVLNQVLAKHFPSPARTRCSVCVDEIIEGKNVVVRDLHKTEAEVSRLRDLVQHAIAELPQLGTLNNERSFALWQKLRHELYVDSTGG